MPTSITKLVPQAVVLAAAIYWSWPALTAFFSPSPLSATKAESTKAKSQEFTAAVLSPTFPPPSKRNPFESPGEKHLPKTKSRKGAATNTAHLAAAEVKDSGLLLNATCIMGEQRLALINGKVYKEKDEIQGPGASPASWVVIEILPHKVLLSCQGTPLQLSYTNTTAARSATRANSPAADKSPRRSAK
jgi:hypothetical protein